MVNLLLTVAIYIANTYSTILFFNFIWEIFLCLLYWSNLGHGSKTTFPKELWTPDLKPLLGKITVIQLNYKERIEKYTIDVRFVFLKPKNFFISTSDDLSKTKIGCFWRISDRRQYINQTFPCLLSTSIHEFIRLWKGWRRSGMHNFIAWKQTI